jgi:hypothetical protein
MMNGLARVTARKGSILDFTGEFETHITVAAADAGELDRLKDWSARRGYSFHHIILDRGLIPSQPMVSYRGHGDLGSERATAEAVARQLTAVGFTVFRIKIEAAPDNRNVPQSDDEAAALGPGRYFEHHAKIALEPGANTTPLVAVARRHAAHLSRNALRVRSDGRLERFVTQRCYDTGRPGARQCLQALLDELAANRYVVLNTEEEFVVYDTQPGVDAGWLDSGESS